MIQDFHESLRNLESRLALLKPFGTSLLFDALDDGIRKIQDTEQQRKALIVFTDGNDNGSQAGPRSVELAAGRSGVLIYFVAIGPRIHIDQHILELLAGESGGRVIYMARTDSVPAAITAIRTELAKQYYLGYYISRRPGAHKIRVEIPSRTGLRIRAKTGYIG
jgi:Ca-activated chloride channel family protein